MTTMTPDNPRFPHKCKITRKTASANPLVDEMEKEVIYVGSCRGYDHNTTSDKGDVIVSNRKLALPLTKEEWENRGVIPQEGDIIVVDKGVYKEYGIVKDKMPGNLGTTLLWNYVRN